MKRKIVDWDEIPAMYKPVLECGHKPLEYEDYGLDQAKADSLKEYECYECQREYDRVARLTMELDEAKRALK